MGALTTLDAVKLHLGTKESSEDDALLNQLINQASADIESRCNRTLSRETRTNETYDCTGGTRLYLDLYPIYSVASVTVDGETVTDYQVQSLAGYLDREDGWDGEVKVTYTGGYLLEPITGPPAIARDLPYDLEYACILWVSGAYNSRGSEHLSDETIGPLKSVFWPEQPAIKAIVNRYRRINV